MLLSKRRKANAECQVFQEKWTTSYLFMEVNGKPVCLVCSQRISVLKEYNLTRHYQANHAENYNNFQGQHRAEQILELLTGLKKQQAVFSCS